MTCKDIQAKFSEYYDTGDVLLDVAEHLKKCQNCAAEYNEYAKLFNQVRNLPEPALPENFHNDLMNYVHKNKQPIHKLKPVARWNVAFSAVAAAAIVLFFIWFAGGTAQETSPYPIDFMPMDAHIGFEPIEIELSVENESYPLCQETQVYSPFARNIDPIGIDFEPVMFCLEADEPVRSYNLLIVAICLMLLAIGGLVAVNIRKRKLRSTKNLQN